MPVSVSEIDWEAVEREFRAGQISIREIGRAFGCSDTLIRKRAKEQNWSRDLTHAVQAAISEKLVTAPFADPTKDVTDQAESRRIVEAAALRGVEIISKHRLAAGKAHKTAEALLAELDLLSSDPKGAAAAIKAEPDERRRPALRNALTVGSRAMALVNIVNALKIVIGLERQAFGLKSDAESSDARQSAPVIYLPSNGRDASK